MEWSRKCIVIIINEKCIVIVGWSIGVRGFSEIQTKIYERVRDVLPKTSYIEQQQLLFY